MDTLKGQWPNTDTTIICASDGGLKDNVGTSSYAFFLPYDEEPILTGFSVEYQPHLSASSTRQELLGQLAAKYWLHKWRTKWNSPRFWVNLILVTDSQSSIDILKLTTKIIGISDTLRPELDVALELNKLQVSNP